MLTLHPVAKQAPSQGTPCFYGYRVLKGRKRTVFIVWVSEVHHYPRVETLSGKTVCESCVSVYVCVCVKKGFMAFIGSYYWSESFRELKSDGQESQLKVTHVVDVRNVVFVHSNCLLKEKHIIRHNELQRARSWCRTHVTSACFMNSPIFVTRVRNLL